MITSLVNFMGGGLITILSALVSLLPVSPLSPYIQQIDTSIIGTGLGYLNYIVPVGTLLGIAASWLAAVFIYNGYLLFARWLRNFKK